jgi:hypothetical protein
VGSLTTAVGNASETDDGPHAAAERCGITRISPRALASSDAGREGFWLSRAGSGRSLRAITGADYRYDEHAWLEYLAGQRSLIVSAYICSGCSNAQQIESARQRLRRRIREQQSGSTASALALAAPEQFS